MSITKSRARFFHFVRKERVQHTLFWVAVIGLFWNYFAIETDGAILLRNYSWENFVSALIYAFTLMVPVYFNFFFIYRRNVEQGKGFGLISGKIIKGWGFYFFLLSTGLCALFFSFVLDHFGWLDHLFSNEVGGTRSWTSYFPVIFSLMMVTCGISYSKIALEENREKERNERQIEIRRRRRAEDELREVKKIINHHFLMNALQDIHILAKNKSDKVPDIIMNLAKILRQMVYRENTNFSSLKDEKELLENYIELQKIKFSKGIDVELNFIGKWGDARGIYPLLLIGPVENCFKHFDKKNNRWIKIDLEQKNGSIELRTQNAFVEKKKIKNVFGGKGLEVLAEKLKRHYKENEYQMNIKDENGVFHFNLKIPLYERQVSIHNN